jgi:hypothetical protein
MDIKKVMDQLEGSVKGLMEDLEAANKDSELHWEFAEWLAGDNDIDSAWQEFLKERE